MDTETNLPAKKSSASKAVAVPPSWGQREVDSGNFLISQVKVMQFMSELVKDNKAKFGEFRDNVTGELLAQEGKSLQFIPIDLIEKWVVKKLDGKKWVFKEAFPYNKANSNLAKEETVNGETIKRIHAMDFYVLLMEDLKKGIDFPKVISFQVTSLRGGKVLYTQCYVLNPRQGLSPAGMVMSVSAKKVDGPNGTYAVMEVVPVEKAHADYVEAAKTWYDTIHAGKTEVVEDTEAGD